MFFIHYYIMFAFLISHKCLYLNVLDGREWKKETNRIVITNELYKFDLVPKELIYLCLFHFVATIRLQGNDLHRSWRAERANHVTCLRVRNDVCGTIREEIVCHTASPASSVDRNIIITVEPISNSTKSEHWCESRDIHVFVRFEKFHSISF